jgi:hypothetical protein
MRSRFRGPGSPFMPGIHDAGLFVVSGLLFNVTPGPDTNGKFSGRESIKICVRHRRMPRLEICG